MSVLQLNLGPRARRKCRCWLRKDGVDDTMWRDIKMGRLSKCQEQQMRNWNGLKVTIDCMTRINYCNYRSGRDFNDRNGKRPNITALVEGITLSSVNINMNNIINNTHKTVNTYPWVFRGTRLRGHPVWSTKRNKRSIVVCEGDGCVKVRDLINKLMCNIWYIHRYVLDCWIGDFRWI